MKITVSGSVGSGKSTISRKLADKLGYRYYSVGELMREIAKKRGMDINKLSAIAEKDSSIDVELDQMQVDIGKTEDDFIMDSRLGFHFVPDSVKVFLTVDLDEAAKRIIGDNRDVEKYGSIQDATKHLKKRMESEKQRYKEYYDIDFPNKKYFDMVIDTTDKEPDQVVEIIASKINQTR